MLKLADKLLPTGLPGANPVRGIVSHDTMLFEPGPMSPSPGDKSYAAATTYAIRGGLRKGCLDVNCRLIFR